MDSLTRLLRLLFLPPDPYERGRDAYLTGFFEEGIFSAFTVCGCRVEYELSCGFRKQNHREFKDAKMLEKSAQRRFLEMVNQDLVEAALKKKGRFIRILLVPSDAPKICQIIEKDGNKYLAADLNCAELNDELRGTPFRQCGCYVDMITVKFLSYKHSDALIEENYRRMEKIFDLTALRANPAFAKLEEAQIIAFAKSELDLRMRYAPNRIDESHSSKGLVINARLIGRVLEISWRLKRGLADLEQIRGFTKEGKAQFSVVPELDAEQIVDSHADGSIRLTPPPGRQQYFLFQIYENNVLQAADTVKFSVRIPTKEEMAEFDAFLASASQKAEIKPTVNVKTQAAVEELMGFVEFDEHFSALEKQLVELIGSKGYTDEEKEEKISRLKLVIEQIRQDHS